MGTIGDHPEPAPSSPLRRPDSSRRRGQAREDFVLGEQGASLLMLLLMAKSRHKRPENVRRYFKPSPKAIAELTSLLAPGDSRR